MLEHPPGLRSAYNYSRPLLRYTRNHIYYHHTFFESVLFSKVEDVANLLERESGESKEKKEVQQETAYSAVVVNDHMYSRPYIVFDPKRVMET